MSDEFTCDNCNKTFPKAWSDGEAWAESRATFGFRPSPADEAIICDDCWKEFLPWAKKEGLTL